MTKSQDTTPPQFRQLTRDEEKALRSVMEKALRHVVGKHSAHLDDAEDAVQAMAIEVTKSQKLVAKLADDEELGLFMTIASRRYLDRVKANIAEKARREKLRSQPRDTATSAEDRVIQTRLFIPAGIDLTEKQLEYLELVMRGEMTISELAHHNGTTERAVRRVLTRARAKLQDHLLGRS